jgi:TonB family protein
MTARARDAFAQPTDAGNVVPPSVVHRVDPVYPPSALAAREQGDVVLTLTIDVEGHVSKVELAQSSGATDLDDAAITAARKWTFVPAMRGATRLASRIRMKFSLAPPEPPAPSPAPAAPPTPPPPAPPAAPGAPAGAAPPEAVRVAPFRSSTAMPAAAASSSSAAPGVRPVATEKSADEEGVQQVDIHGHLEARQHGASDYQFVLDKQKVIPRANASHALELMPGFFLSNEGGAGHAEQVFLRGFDAREGQDLEFTVDGVPINDSGNYHGNGYADTHFIIPELIYSLRVLEGPYAPQQGNFAVAGSADYHLGLDRRGLTTQYTVGSYNTQRLLLMWGPNDAPAGTFAAAEYYTTDGFGVNRQAKRGTAIGQWETPLGRGTLRINATAYFTEYSNAGVVREDDYESGKVDFYGTEDPNQTGNTASRASASITYEKRFKDIDSSQQLYFVDRTMRLRENWTGFLLDVQQPTQEPHAQRGDLIDFHFDEISVGARGMARWHGSIAGLRQELEAGYFGRLDQTDSTQDRIAAGSNTPYLQDANLTSTLGDVGVYLDGNVRVLPWLSARGGVRADMFFFDVLNHCDVKSVDDPSKAVAASQIDQSCLSELEHGVYREPFQRSATGSGAIMPRGTLLVGPFQGFEFTLSAGNGVRSVDPSYVSQGLQTPFVSAQSRDLGVSYQATVGESIGLVAKSVFFQTHVDQDLLFNPTEGRNTLANGSTRTGWAGSVRALGPFYDVAANATFVKAAFDDTGLLVPYVPDVVVRGDLVAFHDLPWPIAHEPVRGVLGYGLSYVGRRPLPYSGLGDVYFISDATLGVAWDVFEVRLEGTNLFDSKYRLGEYNYASNFQRLLPAPTLAPERAFTAGAPRMVLLDLLVTLGGPS